MAAERPGGLKRWELDVPKLGSDQLPALLGSWPECRTWQERQAQNLQQEIFCFEHPMLQKCSIYRPILRQSTAPSSECGYKLENNIPSMEPTKASGSKTDCHGGFTPATFCINLATAEANAIKCRAQLQSLSSLQHACGNIILWMICSRTHLKLIFNVTCHMRLSAMFIIKIRTSAPIPCLPLILGHQPINIWLSANHWCKIQSVGL